MSFKTLDYYRSLSSAAVGPEKFTMTQITAKSRNYELNRCIVNAISSSLLASFPCHFSVIISYSSVSIPVQSVFVFCLCLPFSCVSSHSHLVFTSHSLSVPLSLLRFLPLSSLFSCPSLSLSPPVGDTSSLPVDQLC